MRIKSKTTTSPPGSPAVGDRYYLPSSGSGDWSGQSNVIMVRMPGAWIKRTMLDGERVYVDDETKEARYDGSALVDDRVPTLEWCMTFDCSNRPNIDANTGTIVVGDASLVNATDYDSCTGMLNFSDAQKRAWLIAFEVPSTLDVTKVVTGTVTYHLSGTVSSGHAVEIEWSFRNRADNAALLDAGTLRTGANAKNISSTGSNHTSGDVVKHDLGTIFAANSLAVGDVVTGTIFRDANVGNADDTYTGTVQMMRLTLKGTMALRT